MKNEEFATAVNKITVTSPLLPDLEEFHGLLKEIWASKWVTNMGQFHRQLERALAEYLKVPYISLFTNGTLPLLTALQALRIKGEVITTPYSFVATTHAIWWNGCTPVFVDIEEDTCGIDPDKIEAAITPRTTAIMPVHCYGHPVKMKRIQEIADHYGLKVIYDAAHAFGVEVAPQQAPKQAPQPPKGGAMDGAATPPLGGWGACWGASRGAGVSVLSFGDMSTLSFHATKVFNTLEGGALVVHDEQTKRHIDNLKNFGFRGETEVVAPGINSKMDEVRCAYGLLNLKQVDAAIEARRKVAKKYVEALKEVQGIRMLAQAPQPPKGGAMDGAATPPLGGWGACWAVRHNYSYFPIFVSAKEYGMTRDELYFKLQERGIFGRRYFYPLISTFNTYRGLPSAAPANLPVATRIADEVICLPMHHALSEDDIERVVSVVKNSKK